MKKLHSFALYALVTPAITLGAGSVLAQQSTAQDIDREQRSTQRHQDDTRSTSKVKEKGQSTQYDSQAGSQKAADHRNMRDQSRLQNRGYMDSAPANGMHASNLIGADVSISADEDVGSVSDLIIDENGQVVAIVVGVGGFLGMGEKDVAIGWDDVKRSGASDEQELRIDVTREGLQAAPEFKTKN